MRTVRSACPYHFEANSLSPAPGRQPFQRGLDKLAVKERDEFREGYHIDEKHHDSGRGQHPRHAVVPGIRVSLCHTKLPNPPFDEFDVSHRSFPQIPITIPRVPRTRATASRAMSLPARARPAMPKVDAPEDEPWCFFPCMEQ